MMQRFAVRAFMLLVVLVIMLPVSAAVDRDYPKEFYGAHNDRPMLGIYMGGTSDRGGVIVHQVIPGTAADGMGLQDGDVITSLNGVPIKNTRTLYREVQGSDVGAEVAVEINRDGETLTYEGQYGVWPESLPKAKRKTKSQRKNAGNKDRVASKAQRPAVFDALSQFLKRQADKLAAARGPVAISGLHPDKDVVVASPMIKALAAYSLEHPQGFNFHFSMAVDAQHLERAVDEQQGFAPGKHDTVQAPACQIQARVSVDMDEL